MKSQFASGIPVRLHLLALIALLAVSCDQSGEIGEPATSDRELPVVRSAGHGRPIPSGMSAGPELRKTFGPGPDRGIDSRTRPTVFSGPVGAHSERDSKSPFAFLRLVSVAHAQMPNLLWDMLWQNTGTGGDGNRGFWPMRNEEYIGGWKGLGLVGGEWDIAGFFGDALVWQNMSTGLRGVWPMYDAIYLGGWDEIGLVPTEWDIAGLDDFNGDLHPDILWQNRVTGMRGIWTMATQEDCSRRNPSGECGTGRTVTNWFALGAVGLEWDIAGVDDFTGDGDPDIVWQNLVTGMRGIWPMDGTAYNGGWHGLGEVGLEWRIAGAFITRVGRVLAWENLSSGRRGAWPMTGPLYNGGWLDWGTASPSWRIAGAVPR